MYYSNGLEYIIGSSYLNKSYSGISYFSKSVDDGYGFKPEPTALKSEYSGRGKQAFYQNQQYSSNYAANRQFTPEIFLNPIRPRTKFIDDKNEVKSIAEEIFELMMKEKLPENISINTLPFDEFKALHSRFGSWSSGILGFSVNGGSKKIFVRENQLDALILVTGHEIGHVLTDTLPNKHDEEAKAFSFSIEWAEAIKKHNVAGLASSIKDEFDFQPARNGLHDVAFGFVDFMVKKGRKAIEIQRDLIKGYISVFNRIY